MQNLKPITEIAVENGLPVDELELYGKYKAKVPYTLINQDKVNNSKLILMTSTTPNKAGAGKTTTSIALAQGLKKLGKKATLALREPSLGPVFGMKGGATGGGLSSVHPSNDINLHFNGDFHAITAANNLIAALVDNYRYYNKKNNPLTKIYWKRALDMNDRSLRSMIAGLEGNGLPTETGFDITAASEIMAIFCLAENLVDLEHRINNIRIGKRADGSAFYFGELESTGAVIALLQQAIHPNLVQTTEGVPAFIHGGPFANIAHGCNSVLATRMAMTYGDYAITEAGFGADLGAEKFMNIKCRAAHLQPAATVIVTNSMSLKLHGGLAEQGMKKPAEQELRLGLKNLERHVENMQSFNQKVIIAYNKFPFDSENEIGIVEQWCKDRNIPFAEHEGFAKGSAGCKKLAQTVIESTLDKNEKPITFTYSENDSIEDKLKKIVQKIYRGSAISFSSQALANLKKLSADEQKLPICIAKTQYSFTQDAGISGAPENFEINFKELIVNRGAGFLVAVAGEMLRMPGLPKIPQATKIKIENGEITGLL